jgi:hypothetical protein
MIKNDKTSYCIILSFYAQNSRRNNETIIFDNAVFEENNAILP